MKRVLLTGISGVGKSTITSALAERGYTAIDLDSDAYSAWVEVDAALAQAPGTPVERERDWLWREDRVAHLLAGSTTDFLILSGCAPNMRVFLPQFDLVILLSAPGEQIAERLRTRTTNAYGKQAGEIARVLDLKEHVEPRLRAIAGHELDTTQPLDAVLAQIEQIVRG